MAQLAERLLWEQEVPSSSLGTPKVRVSYSGIMSPFQGEDAGSTPATRSSAPLAQRIERHASDVEARGSNPLGRAREQLL